MRHWLLHLDGFNRLAPGAFKEDNDDIWWSNVKYSPKESTPPSASSDFKQTAFPIIDGVGNSEPSTTPNANLIRQADLENHNKDGGLWIVVEGKVYDVQDSPNGADTPREMLPHFYVGNYFNPPPPDAENQENIATGAIADNQVDSVAENWFAFLVLSTCTALLELKWVCGLCSWSPAMLSLLLLLSPTAFRPTLADQVDLSQVILGFPMVTSRLE